MLHMRGKASATLDDYYALRRKFDRGHYAPAGMYITALYYKALNYINFCGFPMYFVLIIIQNL